MKYVLTSLILAAVIGLSPFFAGRAHADDNVIFDGSGVMEPGSINDFHGATGAGIEYSSKAHTRFIVGLKFDGLPQAGVPSSSWRLFLADAVLKIKPNSDGTVSLDGYDINLSPLAWYKKMGETGSLFDGAQVNVRALPTKFYEDKGLGVKGWGVHAVRVAFALPPDYIPGEPHAANAIMGLAASILGYSVDQDLKNHFTARGISLVNVALRAGFSIPLSIHGKSHNGSELRLRFANMKVDFGTQTMKVNLYSQIAWALKKADFQTSIGLQGGYRANIFYNETQQEVKNAGFDDGYVTFGVSGRF